MRRVEALAQRTGCTPAQLALAWVLGRGDDVFAIPGTRQVRRLEENLGAQHLHLGAGDLRELDAIFPPEAVAGARYADMSFVNR